MCFSNASDLQRPQDDDHRRALAFSCDCSSPIIGERTLSQARQNNDMSHPTAAVNKTLFASHGSWSMARLSISGRLSAVSSAAMTGRSLPLLCRGRTYAAVARPFVSTPAVCSARLAVRQPGQQQYNCSPQANLALRSSNG
jgi:hypothetical protein